MTALFVSPVSRPGQDKLTLVDRVAAAFGAFVAPERLRAADNDNLAARIEDDAATQATSLTDPLALPPDWHVAGDLLSLSFLPFDR